MERPSSEVRSLTNLSILAANNLNFFLQAAELSPVEMVEAVPAFLAKVSKYRPRIVCFVGMGIWRTVEKALVKLMASNSNTVTSTVVNTSKPKGIKRTNAAVVGIQPYRLVHGTEQEQPTGEFQYSPSWRIPTVCTSCFRNFIFCRSQYVWQSRKLSGASSF